MKIFPGGLRRPAGLLLFGWPLLAGCQTLSDREKVWQALHAVDVAQTLSAARDPCYRENAWLTRQLIGRQPSDTAVLAWGVGTAVFHAWLSHEMEARGAPTWVRMAWELGTLGQTAYAIGSNHQNGVRIIADNENVPGCRAD
jgi:hypothetical protein